VGGKGFLLYISPVTPGGFVVRSSAVAAVACLALFAGAQAQTSTVNMQFGGRARSYILHLPTGGGTNLPLMFILHGFGMTAADQQNSVKMDGIADREKFIVAYPNAIDKNWDQAGDSDWKFILAVLDSIDAKHHIEKQRVYLAGFSQGAGMAHAGGCRHADRFAAIAPVSGNIPAECKPVRAIPMFLTFGTKDIATPQKFMQSAASWAALDSCGEQQRRGVDLLQGLFPRRRHRAAPRRVPAFSAEGLGGVRPRRASVPGHRFRRASERLRPWRPARGRGRRARRHAIPGPTGGCVPRRGENRRRDLRLRHRRSLISLQRCGKAAETLRQGRGDATAD
jgi:poly(3-hydroxybutyrate) depolymerase